MKRLLLFPLLAALTVLVALVVNYVVEYYRPRYPVKRL